MKMIIAMYYDYLTCQIIDNCLIGPLEKNALLDRISLIHDLYLKNYISGRECMHMLSAENKI